MRKVVRTLGRGVAVALAAAFAYGAWLYLTLPDVRALRTSNPERTAFQVLRAREAAARGRKPKHVQHWLPYARISPHLTRAVLVAEDARFWQHEGIDLAELRESIEVNIERREFARGASTITQQLAKNLYLTPSKNPLRKVREFLIARRLEAELNKQRILELYLNVIEWGDGVYGAEAAARVHLRKSASQLSPQEAALLAAALVNPRLLDPSHPSARLRRRQQMIARRMGLAARPPARARRAGGEGDDLSEATSPPIADAVPALPTAEPPAALPGEAIPAASPRPEPPCAPDCR
jgi:monofunctional biosynthetic peptidoglycan transglycosylase